MVPNCELPPVTGLTPGALMVQVTAVLEVPVTVAVNCCVVPKATSAEVGVRLTETTGGGLLPPLLLPPPPQPAKIAAPPSAIGRRIALSRVRLICLGFTAQEPTTSGAPINARAQKT